MKSVPELTKTLETQLTRAIRAFERVSEMKVQTVHCKVWNSCKALTEVSVTLTVDDRPLPKVDKEVDNPASPEKEYDPLASEDI